jgi:hypothetical protein
MPSKRAGQPAPSLEGETDDESKEPGSRETLELSAPLFHQEERTTVPARRRSQKYSRVLLLDVTAAAKAADDGE